MLRYDAMRSRAPGAADEAFPNGGGDQMIRVRFLLLANHE